MTEPTTRESVDRHELKRVITRYAAVLLVVSSIIGSGVFKKIAPMSEALQSPMLILGCWAVAGFISLMGALCTAELVAMMPGSGGEYVFFKRIYGRWFSFLYGWGNFTVMKTAAIAALAYIFAESLNVLFPLPSISITALGSVGSNASIKLVASCLIVALSFANHRGVVIGERLSLYLVVCIILVLLSSAFAPFLSDRGSIDNFSRNLNPPEGRQLLSAMFAASLSAFWGYEGWNSIGCLGEEIKEPQRNLPIALGIGTVIVIGLYLLVNSVYLYIMPIEQLIAVNNSENKIAGVEVARIVSGNSGAVLLSCLILLTTFTCTNSTILTSSRIFFAMSRDGLFLKSAGKIHDRFQTPSNAIIIQAVWALVLLWSGTFDRLTDLLVFAAFVFYGATTLGVIILRKKDPEAHRPYRVVGYPVLPILFTLFCITLIGATIFQQPVQAMTGLVLIGSGIPVYLYYERSTRRDRRIES